jgi:hypothetical protein
MPKERTATQARQGESDKRVLTVLVISTLAAAGLAVAAYLYVFAAENEEIAEEPVRIINPGSDG